MNFFTRLESKYAAMQSADYDLDKKMVQFNSWITPDEMEELIKLNYDGNRDFNKPNFRRLVREMNLNRWVLHPDSIVLVKVDGEWVGLNYQHRGNAQIETGVTLPYSICIYHEKEIYKYLDQNKTRTNADVLSTASDIVYPIQYLLRSATPIAKANPDDVLPVLQSQIGELLTEIEYDIKPSTKNGNVWKQTGFRAAYAMAILTNTVTHSAAYEVYTCLTRNDIKEWPDLFVDLYRQVMERRITVNRYGVSLDNDFFMRGFYAFANYDKDKTTVAIHSGFRQNVKSLVCEYMKDYSFDTLELKAA